MSGARILTLDEAAAPVRIAEALSLAYQPVLTGAAVERLEALRGSLAAVQDAAAAAQELREAIKGRAELARGQRADAIRQGSGANLRLADEALAAAGVEAERLDMITRDLPAKLDAARARERERQAEIAARTAEAEDAAKALRKALPAYRKAAEVIAETVALDVALQAALAALRRHNAPVPDSTDLMLDTRESGRLPLSLAVRVPVTFARHDTAPRRVHPTSVYAPIADPAYGRV